MSYDPPHGFSDGAHSAPAPEDMTLAHLGLDPDEQAILTITRYYCQSFADPAAQSWLYALSTASDHFAASGGTEMAFAILDLVQALRHARKSVFCFSNPFCRVYAGRVTRDERNLIGALTAMRRGRASQARAHALIVCEGYDTTAFMGTAFRLACRLPAPAKAKVGA